MTGSTRPRSPTVFVSADWSKEVGKRSVCIADVRARRIVPAASGNFPWTLTHLMELARSYSRAGSVLVGIDAALGVSGGFWRLVHGPRRPYPFRSFIEWLRHLDPDGRFFGTTTDPGQWSVDQPWFQVRPGAGGRAEFTKHVDDGFLRSIERATHANPLFAVGGIPGTVGSGTRSLWRALIRLSMAGGDFAIWPFEGDLSALLAKHRVVLAETYPRLAYGTVLAEALPAALLRLAKTQRTARESAYERLRRAAWVASSGVQLGDGARVIGNEDDFDAYITAVAVLRCALEGVPLSSPAWVDSEAEGSMLLASAVDFGSPRRRLSSGSRALSTARPPRRREMDSPTLSNYPCPIPGCRHVFRGSRGGWDAHVASLRRHPDWHPAVIDPAARKRLFKREYPNW